MTTLLQTCLRICLALALPTFFHGQSSAFDLIIGGEEKYVVRKNDSPELIGARLGVFWKNIIKENDMDPKESLSEGTVLLVNTRKIVPKVIDNGIVINIPDRMLYLFKDGGLTAFPVGVGIAWEVNSMNWKTEVGGFTIVRKRRNPTWNVPASIQEEMALKGKTAEITVPPGPDNPLGRYALQTSIPGILIHETNRPRSVYRYLSHGCIRVLPEHMERLFHMVEVGEKGEIIYEPVKLAVGTDGRVYLEARTDMYGVFRFKSTREQVRSLIRERRLTSRVDWRKVDLVIQEETGIAEDISLGDLPPVRPLTSRIFGYKSLLNDNKGIVK